VIVSSPRLRRRLIWAAGTLLVVCAVAALVVTGRSSKPDAVASAIRAPGWEPAQPPASLKRSVAQLEKPLAVAARFLTTAVARKNVGSSWELVTPELRQGYTRARWSKGDIPIVPFPVRSARWDLDYSYANEVGLRVAVFPLPGSKMRATVFNLDLRALGPSGKRRWLVSGFTPAGVSSSAASGSAPKTSLADARRLERRAEARLSAAWLFVPLGILGFALLIPVGLGVSYWLRARRAEREWALGGAGLLDRRELDELVRLIDGDAARDQRQA
jgi:hypothetical protein